MTKEWIERGYSAYFINMEKDLEGNNIKLNKEIRGINPHMRANINPLNSKRIA